MTVGEICKKPVVTARAAEHVIEAAKRMRDCHVGDLVVVDAQSHAVGILTDRDIVVTAVAQSAGKLNGLLVGDIMSRELATTTANESIGEALTKMWTHGVRRLPVVTAEGRLDGLIALDDILEVMREEFMDVLGLVAREQRHERELRK